MRERKTTTTKKQKNKAHIAACKQLVPNVAVQSMLSSIVTMLLEYTWEILAVIIGVNMSYSGREM